MNSKTRFITLLLPVFFFAACFGERNDKEVNEIAGLRVKLEQTDSILKLVDKDEAEKKAAEVKNNAQFIQYNINKIGDTLDFKTALFLNYYRSLLMDYQNVASTYEKIELATDSLEKNLNNLEHDIKSNSLAEGLTPEQCVESESEKINYFYQHAQSLKPMLEKAKASYDTLAPKVANYMNELNVKLTAKFPEGH